MKYILLTLGLGLGTIILILVKKAALSISYSERQAEGIKIKKQNIEAVDYDKLIKEKEEEIYPKLLSFYVYLESNIRNLPTHLASILEEKYGFSKVEPTLDWGKYKWDPNLDKYLEIRINREPEIKEKITLTGSWLADYYSFLRKKAQLEAEKIVNNLLGKKGGQNEI